MEAGFYGVKTLGGYIGDGVSQAHEADLRGVVKTDEIVPYTVANEYVAASIAFAAGLPVPPSTIATLDDGRRAFLMMRFGLKGEKPPPADLSALVNDRPETAAGIVVFDSLIMNQDRHKKNLAYVPGGGVSMFDHGHALLGPIKDQGVHRLDSDRDNALWGGELVPQIKDPNTLRGWAKRLAKVPPELIRDKCETVREQGAASPEEAAMLEEVLVHRQGLLLDFVEAHDGNFASVLDWSLTAAMTAPNTGASS